MNYSTVKAFEPILILISGPAGVGKDAVVSRLKQRSEDFHFVITATTRKKRTSEVEGVDYFFLSKEAFEQMIANDELLEYALVYNEYKGVPKEQVRMAMASGKDVLMRVNVDGAATIKQKEPNTVTIFLSAGSDEILEARLRGRKTETIEQFKLRTETAKKEALRVNEFEYHVVNREGKLDETVDAILNIIQAEHHRSIPRKLNL